MTYIQLWIMQSWCLPSGAYSLVWWVLYKNEVHLHWGGDASAEIWGIKWASKVEPEWLVEKNWSWETGIWGTQSHLAWLNIRSEEQSNKWIWRAIQGPGHGERVLYIMSSSYFSWYSPRWFMFIKKNWGAAAFNNCKFYD